MRPTVWLNCAASLDGKLASPDGEPMPLSDEVDWRRVHRMRADVDAILVGVGTILRDDPALKVRPEFAPASPTRKLLRIVLDTRGRTPRNARVVDGSAPTLLVTAPGIVPKWPKAEAVQVPALPAGSPDAALDLGILLNVLHARGVRRLLVEGGARVLRSFLDTPYVDRWTLYVAPVLVGGQGPSIFDGRPSGIGRRLHVENVEPQGKGVLWTIRP